MCRSLASRIRARREPLTWFGLVMLTAVVGTSFPGAARGQSFRENQAKLSAMTGEQKEALRSKKARFDELSDTDKQRLRDLHASISSDPAADELIATVKSYSRWLTNLDPLERATLQSIDDPAKRIARIKELIQQQEERRFKQYFSNLPDEERKTIYQWHREFVSKHAQEILEKLPPPARHSISEATDEDSRLSELVRAWQRFRLRADLVMPAPEEYQQLFDRFSPESQKAIESAVATALAAEPEEERTPERQKALHQQRMRDLMLTALYTRYFPQVSNEELHKFLDAMKSDDRRRKQLEGKEGEEFRRELQRMYNAERFFGPGWGPGPGGPRFGPGGPPPGPPPRDGRGRPGERPNGDERGTKSTAVEPTSTSPH